MRKGARMAVKEEEKEKTNEKTVVYSEMTKADSPAFQWFKKILSFFFVVIFMGACLWQVHSLRQQGKQLDQNLAKLEEQIEEEKAKELEIKVDQEYYQSEKYKEQLARDRCKLIYPDEILVNILK